MNRKIFTLLAAAFMLFSIAYNVQARSVAQRSIGELVKSLPGDGMSKGMYHILVDSILLDDYGRVAATFDTVPNAGGQYGPFLYYDRTTGSFRVAPQDVSLGNFTDDVRDTIVLAVTEMGQVKMISIKDLREDFQVDQANVVDLQASMWCIDLLDTHELGQLPTFHFMNKIFELDLEYDIADVTYVSGQDQGWMYSYGYKNDMLNSKQPFRRLEDGQMRVVSAQIFETGPNAGLPTGLLSNKVVDVDVFLAEAIDGFLKFSIRKVSPFVMMEEDFNMLLGYGDGKKNIKLNFDPATKQPNVFADYFLRVEQSNTLPAVIPGVDRDDYLNVAVYDSETATTPLGYIFNSNLDEADDPDKYNNTMTEQYLNLRYGDIEGLDDEDYNYSYRFIYFPSEDSLVINAYYAKHDTQTTYASASFVDDGPSLYRIDTLEDYYYGLYNDTIHYALIVRYQDLNSGESSMMTVANHPSRTRIFFNLNNCKQMLTDYWIPAKGVYTIWDQRGRALGIQIYNGTYTPQWLPLEEDAECPDRIPSYQWVIEPAAGRYRVNITNREFGDMLINHELVQMANVLIRRGYSRIFNSLPAFKYGPLAANFNLVGYEPIHNALVKGEYLEPITDLTACGTGEGVGYSGFRPVNADYLANEFLGYKHFYVGKDPSAINFNTSEDIMIDGQLVKGMDYNEYAFNWFSGYGVNSYIYLGERYEEILLKAEENKKTGFQFRLGRGLRGFNQNEEESYGYKGTDADPLPWEDVQITDVAPFLDPANYHNISYIQHLVPILKRYYYEIKVADFYKYRDGLAEQFVVLKGARTDYNDLRNAMKYGVDDITSTYHPFKTMNFYMRETYFLKPTHRRFTKPLTDNDEIALLDPTRRIFYALLDRVELDQIDRVTAFGLQISDTLKSEDGSTPYNLVVLDVDYASQWINARGKTGSAVNVSTFSLENVTYDLYRRLRSMRDDNATPEGDLVAPGDPITNLDAPKTLRIYRDRGRNDYLYEDAISQFSDNFGIGFLGVSNSAENQEIYAPDGTVKYNYNLFIDTAFINRGTGPIKPQYLIAVDPKLQGSQEVCYYDDCGDIQWGSLEPYIKARYLVNATDSARQIGSDGNKDAPKRDERFIMDTNWDRLAFVDAIHAHDRLYILSELNKYGVLDEEYIYESCDGAKYYDVGNLMKMTQPGGKLYGTARTWDNSKMLGAYYDFADWDNYHNDVCFSLRFILEGIRNPDENGDDTFSNDDKRFYIESETTNREPFGNRKIAPVQGGWVFLQNGVPVLSRTSYEDPIQQAERFNVDNRIEWQNGKATYNEELPTKFNVIAGDGIVTIVNAAGKQVTISNMLGQTLVKKALAGNNETVTVSKGIAVVTVEGEKTVKVIIK